MSTQDEAGRIQAAVSRVKESIGELQKKLAEFDAAETSQQVKESASSYLDPAVEKAKASLEEIVSKVKIITDTAQDIPVRALSNAYASLGQALEQVKNLAKSYDEKYQVQAKVLVYVTPAQEKCMEALAQISEITADASAQANAQLQGVNDGIRNKVTQLTLDTTSFLVATAAGLDAKYNIGGRTVEAAKGINEKYKVEDKAKELDEKYHLQQKAQQALEKGQELDSRFTGGRVSPLVQLAYEKGLDMVEYLTNDFQTKKLSLGQDGAAVEPPTAPASE